MGLTGGIATGKSTVARLFRRRGAAVVDADLIARSVTAPGSPTLAAIVRAFGQEMVDRQGRLRRRALAEVIFGNRQAREGLDRITHPKIARELRRQIREVARSAHPPPLIVAVVPLLVEAGMQDLFDGIIVVYARQREQVTRLTRRDGLSRYQGLLRIRAQMPTKEKIRYADWVIDGEKSRSQVARAVDRIWREVTEAANE